MVRVSALHCKEARNNVTTCARLARPGVVKSDTRDTGACVTAARNVALFYCCTLLGWRALYRRICCVGKRAEIILNSFGASFRSTAPAAGVPGAQLSFSPDTPITATLKRFVCRGK